MADFLPRGEALQQVEVGLLQNLVTILGDPAQGDCVLCDPAFEVDRLYRLCEARGQRVAAVVLTHGHPDHIEGVPEVIRRSGAVPIYVGEAEAAAVAALCRREGVTPALRPLSGDEGLRLAGLALQVLATPGHTAAGLSYYLPDIGAALTGDTLFVGSCGRAASPGADTSALYRSLQRLAALPEETRIYPGHDYGRAPTSTIGLEREQNRYLRCPDEAAFARLLRR